ncbi:MAG: hypothetical protein K2K98_05305 [Muribaculaceae bacterium]|nr:hypothetical protein [Muribaculaceae bacterium]
MNTIFKYRYRLLQIHEFLIMCLMGVVFTSCSTGIESTKKIRMTKEDVRLMEKTPEQKFAESIQGSPLSSWPKGKPFLAMSDRTVYIFEPNGQSTENTDKSLKGKTLTFEGIENHTNPDLQEECVLIFSDGTQTYRYHTGKSTETAMKEIDSSRLPLISDIALIEEWKNQITGKTLWTKSNLWYDSTGDRKSGLKFAKVTIEDVCPATGDFPIMVKISGSEGESSYLQMNYTSDLHDSRNFAAIFFLSDPKGKYPHISKENWALIQRGKVGEGMTKEECKLSIGNPDEVRSGHNRSQTMDIWQYSDGTYLMFTDGLLTKFRQ